MHNPIQIVLQPSQLIYSPDRNPGGKNTDFYGERDKEFAEHKIQIIDQIADLSRALQKNIYSEVGVAKVTLKPQALAKSHRPTRSLFRSDTAPCLGSGSFGELYFQVTSDSLERISKNISSAEYETRWKENTSTGKLEYNPSRARSETGALSSVSFYSPSQKASFEAQDAIAWLEKNSTGRGYIVEIFPFHKPEHKDFQNQEKLIRHTESTFLNGLLEFGSGLVVENLSKRGLAKNTFYIQLSTSKLDPIINLSGSGTSQRKGLKIDSSEQRHRLLLRFLKNHPVVKRISLPPELSRTQNSEKIDAKDTNFPFPDPTQNYPIAGVVDTGVRSPTVKKWCIQQSIGFDHNDCDPNHGSQVASLIVGAQYLNGVDKVPEEDGCKIYDIWTPIHNNKDSFSDYFDGVGDFFDWLDLEVETAKRHGVKIFNFSINFKEHVSTSDYSKTATLLDEISEKHGVIFVISAGNLLPIDHRPKWPSKPELVTEYIATYGINDRIFQPSDAVKAVTVAAINPKGCDKNIEGAPAVYSRRGPGVSLGVKPDVAHLGGHPINDKGATGLISISSGDEITNDCGTSFAAPLITKTLAFLDFRTKHSLSRESLIALLIHHSNPTKILVNKRLPKAISRQFVGFGMPVASKEMLLTDDHSITIVFSGVIQNRQIGEFNFTWPQSLTNSEGKCRGEVTLTLVYATKTAPEFGAEYCRTNVDASLRQERFNKKKNEWNYEKAVDSIWHTQLGNDPTYEKNLIEHGLKWWPIKKYQRTMKGVGVSSNWQLNITPQMRSDENFPSEGISFCAVMTITDNKKISNSVFDEMRNSIQSTGVSIGSITTQTQITT